MEIDELTIIKEMLKAGRSVEELNAMSEIMQQLAAKQPPEKKPTEQPPESSSEAADEIKQLKEQLEATKQELATECEQKTKLQADLAAAQKANTRQDAGEDDTDPYEPVRELFRRS